MNFEEASAAAKRLRNRPTDAELLQLYGLYKQATIGDCNTERPGFFDPKGRAKYDSWKKLSGMHKTEAAHRYISLVEQLIERYGVLSSSHHHHG